MRRNSLALMFVYLLTPSLVLAGGFAVDWQSVDGGGRMDSSGGGYAVSGTIGQPDASLFNMPMTGGGYEVVGGFWPVAAVPEVCACPGDVMPDALINGRDIQAFTDCLLGGGSNCDCADTDPNGLLDVNDVDAFVIDLLAGATCP